MKKRLIQYLFSFAVAICLLMSGGISVSAETAGESDSVKVGDDESVASSAKDSLYWRGIKYHSKNQ